MHVQTKVELVTDNNKRFGIGSDITFDYTNQTTKTIDRITCRICEMSESIDNNNGFIIADKIRTNNKQHAVIGKAVFYFYEIKNPTYPTTKSN